MYSFNLCSMQRLILVRQTVSACNQLEKDLILKVLVEKIAFERKRLLFFTPYCHKNIMLEIQECSCFMQRFCGEMCAIQFHSSLCHLLNL